MTQTKTKIEIINETVEYYRTRNRAMTAWGCLYYVTAENLSEFPAPHVKVGDMCAVGRCLENPEDAGVCPVSQQWNTESLDRALKPEYRGHSIHFWQNLQRLHDTDNYWDWNEHGGCDLTENGIAYVDVLKERYASKD